MGVRLYAVQSGWSVIVAGTLVIIVTLTISRGSVSQPDCPPEEELNWSARHTPPYNYHLEGFG